MILESTLSPVVAPVIPTGNFWRVVMDTETTDPGQWGGASRVVHPSLIGYGFRQLPAVYRYSRSLEYYPSEYRVSELPLLEQYYRINNYDGLGAWRCENYLFGSANALYNVRNAENGRGFPDRQYLTMSNNTLKEVAWAADSKGRRYLKFETITPNTDVSQMTHESHPWLVHRYSVSSYDFRDMESYTTFNTPKGLVYFFLTSQEGYSYIPERFVRQA